MGHATVNCVGCYAPGPRNMGGHVHKDGEKVLARFCQDCFHKLPTVPDCKGCYGDWTPDMGVEDDGIYVAYIDTQTT